MDSIERSLLVIIGFNVVILKGLLLQPPIHTCASICIHMYIAFLCVSNLFFCLKVFHVPHEERRYHSDPAPFGAETTQASIVREIMEKTGCSIEMNQTKDHSLTIMVTGRPSSVVEAKKEINQRLHQQVRGSE